MVLKSITSSHKMLDGLQLVIFSMPGNTTTETSDFADPRFSFEIARASAPRSGVLMAGVLMEKTYCETLTVTFIREQKLKYSTIVYIKITCLNRIYNKFDNN